MCLLIFYPENVQPDVTALYIGADNNPDGFGYAIVADGQLIVGRGMHDSHVIERFAKLRKQYPHGPALFHARIGTAGVMDESNCHPFYVGGDRRTVIAHNGILPRKAQPTALDRRSDTHLFAAKYLPANRFGTLRSAGGRRHLELWMGSGNKVVALTVDPSYGWTSVILNERAGHWTNGIWYSNDSYKYRWSRYTMPNVKYVKNSQGRWVPDYQLTDDEWYAYWKEEYLNTPDEGQEVLEGTVIGYPDGNAPLSEATKTHCELCGSRYAVSTITRICTVCRSCQECGMTDEECFCYLPAALRTELEREVEGKR